ncbi:hypothetical protein L6452_37177 [Arctium lappa]|uniref:Uncharacterized protein n=1 Tax=Arctium lappa TaxID=4217 RepID=A0ACB8Y2S3_ARCLA|nr:hypothetical protein L6452_37177 [Arctium lappa]
MLSSSFMLKSHTIFSPPLLRKSGFWKHDPSFSLSDHTCEILFSRNICPETDTWNRISSLIYSSLTAFASSYISLLILRCFGGLGIGCRHVLTSWFIKFFPTPNRRDLMVVSSVFWTVGTIMEASLP